MKKFFTVIFTICSLVLLDIIYTKIFFYTLLKPNFLLIYILFVALFIGHTDAVILGFICGMLLDILNLKLFGVNTFVLMTIGYIFGFLNKRIDETLIKVQILSLFLSSVFFLFIYYIILSSFSLSKSFSYHIFFIPLFDIIFGYLLLKIFVWYYKLLGII